jgi:hypothetical protein
LPANFLSETIRSLRETPRFLEFLPRFLHESGLTLPFFRRNAPRSQHFLPIPVSIPQRRRSNLPSSPSFL